MQEPFQPGRSLNHHQGWPDAVQEGKKVAEAVPDQQAAAIDGVAAVGTFVVNGSVNLKVPLTR